MNEQRIHAFSKKNVTKTLIALLLMTITEKILEYLQLQAESTVDLFGIMMTDRRAAMRKARHSIIHGPRQFKHNWADLYNTSTVVYILVSGNELGVLEMEII